jgi:hypothetical protein
VKKSRSPVTTPALIAMAGRGPSAIARATIAVTAGPGVSAATATVAVSVRKTPGVTAGYSQPLRRKYRYGTTAEATMAASAIG